MAVSARFYISEITKRAIGAGTTSHVVLQPVLRPTEDNVNWSKYTPSGKIEMNVSAEGAAAWFESMLGQDVAITFDAALPEE